MEAVKFAIEGLKGIRKSFGFHRSGLRHYESFSKLGNLQLDLSIYQGGIFSRFEYC